MIMEKTSIIYLVHNYAPVDQLRKLLDKVQSTKKFTEYNSITNAVIRTPIGTFGIPADLMKYINGTNGAEVSSEVKYDYINDYLSLIPGFVKTKQTYDNGVIRVSEDLDPALINIRDTEYHPNEDLKLHLSDNGQYYLKFTYTATYELPADVKDLEGKHKDRVIELMQRARTECKYDDYQFIITASKADCKEKTTTYSECEETLY